MNQYQVVCVELETGEPKAQFTIYAVDYDTAQTLAEALNLPFGVYVNEAGTEE